MAGVYSSDRSLPVEQLTITYGIPQGSVLGPTLFNIHIDSISDVCDSCDIVLYADDTGIHTSSKDVKIAEQYVNEDLGRVTDRLSTDGLICNHKKSEAILIGSKHAVKNAPDLQIIMDGRLLKQCEDFKYLGVYIDNTLSWNKHITYLASRIYPKLKMLNRIAPFLSQRVLLNIYKQTILPKRNSGIEENIRLTKDKLKQIRDHVFHSFCQGNQSRRKSIALPKTNKIWTQWEEDGTNALLFRKMPMKYACLIDMNRVIHFLKGLSVWILI